MEFGEVPLKFNDLSFKEEFVVPIWVTRSMWDTVTLQLLPSLTSLGLHVIKASFVRDGLGVAQPQTQTSANVRRGQAQHFP